MRICIDVSAIIYETGVSVYTRNLVENLLKIDSKNEYILFGGSLRRRMELKAHLNNFRRRSLQVKKFLIPPTLANLIWNKLHVLPIEKLVGDIDVFHSSDWTQPPSKAFKITTIHDLTPLKFPEITDPKIVSAHKARLRWAVAEVDRVIVPSRTTLEDVVKIGIDERRVRVIPEAPDPIFKPARRVEIERVKRKYRISGNYILAVGVASRKNTQRIVEAYERLKADINLKLVIVGYPYIKLVLPRGVIMVGHVEKTDLSSLYSGAQALVYPSFYEGFGLPILEAFVCRTPVITSNLGSMAEVAGKAAVLVDPHSVDSISEGILKAIKNRKKLVERGFGRVKRFSWAKTAKETLKVYGEVTSDR